jgi:hypothetical protein
MVIADDARLKPKKGTFSIRTFRFDINPDLKSSLPNGKKSRIINTTGNVTPIGLLMSDYMKKPKHNP